MQLFGFNINLSKNNPDSEANFQFLLDTFVKKEKTESKSSVDLRIGSILVRRGKIAYNLLSAPETPGHFNTSHINIQNIIANISLKAFQSDSINIDVKRLSIEEASGLDIRKLGFKLTANDKLMNVANFTLQLPNSSLNFDTLQCRYDSLASFNNFIDEVKFKVKTAPSHFTPSDIAPLSTAFSHFQDPIELQFEVKGSVGEIECPYIEVSSGDILHLRCEALLQGLPNISNAFVYGKVSELYLNQKGINFLVKNFAADESKTPAIADNIGDISFKGEITGYFSDLVTYGTLNSGVGAIKTDVKLTTNKEKESFSYSGTIQSDSLDLGKLLSNKQLGKAAFHTRITGSHVKKQIPDVSLEGLISLFTFKDYRYENILLDGRFNREGFNGNVSMEDTNGSIFLDGIINTNKNIPTFDFTAVVKDFSPHNLNLTSDYIDSDFSIKVRANFEGNSIDNLNGEINIDDFVYNSPNTDYFLDSFNIKATHSSGNNRIAINSEFINANISGQFQYKDIPTSFLGVLHCYLPAFISLPKKARTNNNFTIDVKVENTELLSTVFNIPLILYKPVTLKGYINDEIEKIEMNAHLPRFKYNDKYYESGVVLCNNNDSTFNTEARLTQLKRNGAVSMALLATAEKDCVLANLNWGNNAEVTYSGKFTAHAAFEKREDKSLKTTIDILPTKVIINDSIWSIHPSRVTIEPKNILINDFSVTQDKRFLNIDGLISEDPESMLIAKLNDINIGYVFDIVDVTDDVTFEGDATGTA